MAQKTRQVMTELPKALELTYQSASSNINFIKKQEWIYTSSTLAVYGALVALPQKVVLAYCAKIILETVIAVSVVFSWFIFCEMKKSLAGSRCDIERLQEHPRLRPYAGKPPTRNWFDRWGLFAGLFLISLFGAAIAGYAIWLSPLHPCA
jgi:hypothetical protein